MHHITQALKGIFAARHLGDIQAQPHFVHRGLVQVVRLSGLRVIRQCQQGCMAYGLGRQLHTPRHGCRHKARRCGMLLDIAGAPRRTAGAQHKAQLCVVLSGKLVQLARTADFVQHVWQIDRCIERIAKALYLGHKFRKFNLVERAQAVGQLHPRLKAGVTLAGAHGFPFARSGVEPFNTKLLTACTARGGLHHQRGITRDHAFDAHRGDRIDQAI